MKTHTDERGLTRFFLEPKDAKSPDEPQICTNPTSSELKIIQAVGRINRGIVIDKDLLQEIRDLLNSGADEYAECKSLRDKLDKIYPFLC